MTRKRIVLPLAVCAGLALASAARAQTATHTETISGGTGFTGTIGGTITATVKSETSDHSTQTQGMLNITDLDIHTQAGGAPSHYDNYFPNSTSNNNTASTPINIATPSAIGISIPTTNFSSPVTGSFDITAGDNTANAVNGVLDGGTPGSDGAWDDPNSTGILNGATLDNANITLSNPISANANVTGSLNASIPSDVTIPNVVSGTISVDMRLKNSSSVSVTFDPVQNIQIQNLSITESTPFALGTAGTGNFTDGNHPVPGANPTLDLSTSGAALVTTTISGNLLADITGTVFGNIDVAADVKLNLGALGTYNAGTIDVNDVVNGPLSTGSLIDLSQSLSLPGTSLPFVVDVIHNANSNVDFDDVLAQLYTGTGGFNIPINITENDLAVNLPTSNFEVSGLSFPVGYSVTSPVHIPFDGYINGQGAYGTVYLDHLAASFGGSLAFDVGANLTISANMLATALDANAINVVPEPGSMILMSFAAIGLVGYGIRRRRK